MKPHRNWPSTADTDEAYFDGRSAGWDDGVKFTFLWMLIVIALFFPFGLWLGYDWGYRNGQIDDARGIRHFHEARTFEGETTWIDDREGEQRF